MAPKPTLHHYEEALYAATASGHTRIEAYALTGLASVTGTQMADLETSLRYSRHAMAVTHRLRDPPQLEAGNMLYRGSAYMTANQFDLALEHFRYAVELSRGPSETQQVLLAALNNVAAVLGQQGHYRDARRSKRL